MAQETYGYQHKTGSNMTPRQRLDNKIQGDIKAMKLAWITKNTKQQKLRTKHYDHEPNAKWRYRIKIQTRI